MRVCEELCGTEGHIVRFLWDPHPEMAAKVQSFGATYVGLSPNDFDSLLAAGVVEAESIMTLCEDDRLNLQIALKARDLNPKIRVVLRQFNRTLGRKIEQNLPNCSSLSLSSHAAASYAGAAVDPSCFWALQFPDIDGPLVGFSQRLAGEFGVAHLTCEAAEAKLGCRVVGFRGLPLYDQQQVLGPDDEIVVFGKIASLAATVKRKVVVDETITPAERLRSRLAAGQRAIVKMDPILRRLLIAASLIFVLSSTVFTVLLKLHPWEAVYFVITTMTTTGYGDISLADKSATAKFFGMVMMIAGVAVSGILIAFVSSALTRAQWVSMQGLRKIDARDHVIVCGVGNVGSRVVDYLLELQQRVVVIDTEPDPLTVEQARDLNFDVLTGDATREQTLDLCNSRYARCLIALTTSDTANLEVALGARARNPDLPVVLRALDPSFARSIARQFQITKTFSDTELAAPAFAGLSRFPGTRGRIAFSEEDFTVGERQQGEVPAPPPANACVPLGVWRKGTLRLIKDFAEMEPYDKLLFIVPLSQFRGGKRRQKIGERPLSHVEAN